MNDPVTIMISAIAGALVVREVALLVPDLRMLRRTSRIQHLQANGPLNRAAVPFTLEPELRWAALSNHRVALARLIIEADDPGPAIDVIAAATRRNERSFILVSNELVVSLWVHDQRACVRAVARLADTLRSAGYEVVDVGVAIMPEDGAKVGRLVDVAGTRRRCAQDWLDGAAALGPVEKAAP